MKITIVIRPKNVFDKFINRLDPRVYKAAIGETCFLHDWAHEDEVFEPFAHLARFHKWLEQSRGPDVPFNWRDPSSAPVPSTRDKYK